MLKMLGNLFNSQMLWEMLCQILSFTRICRLMRCWFCTFDIWEMRECMCGGGVGGKWEGEGGNGYSERKARGNSRMV